MAVAVVVLVAMALPSPVNAATAPSALGRSNPDPSEVFADSDVIATQTFFGIDEQAARDRLASENEAMRLSPLLEARFSSTLGGIWLDESGTAQIHLAFTGDASARLAQARKDSKLPERLDARVVKRSKADLLATQQRMLDDRNALQRGDGPPNASSKLRSTGGKYDLDIDVRTNEVVAHTSASDSGADGDFRSRYGDSVRVDHNRAAATACTANDCRFTMRGGLRLTFGNSICSNAFAAIGGSGRVFTLSAGHCGGFDVGVNRSNGGAVYGPVDGDLTQGNTDAERIANNVTDLTNWSDNNPILVDGAFRTITGWLGWSSNVVGVQIGKAGMSGTSRGLITSTNVAPSYIPGATANYIASGACIIPGDSGSAVFRNDKAYGIMTGATTDANGNFLPCSDPGFRSVYGSIEFPLSRLSVGLLG